VLLSLALADRIKELQHEVADKQSLALASAEAALEARERAMKELEERRRLQGELDTVSHHLAQSQNMATLGMLMAGIAHDLRNPLNYVQGASERLREVEGDLDAIDEAARGRAVATVRQVAGWVEQGVSAMDALSVAMRNQSRSAADDADGDGRTAVNLGEVAREALLLCRARVAHCHVSSELDDATVFADPVGLGQVVMNLVSNAADALAEARDRGASEPLEIRVRARATRGGGFVLEVHDSGPGIPEAVRARILEPFFTTKPRGQGTGLGLAIVQRVVKLHGGTLDVGRSEELGGACFRIHSGAVSIAAG
jgi:two-component system NtrC family sensor kinase